MTSNGTKSYDFEDKLYAHITKKSVTPVVGTTKETRMQKAFSVVHDALKVLKFDGNTSTFTEDHAAIPPVIHIAGTKGKGSTCSFIESVLRSQGLKTGLFTSPHLVKVNERVRINGKPISDAKMQHYVDLLHEKLQDCESYTNKNLGFFRLMTVLAFYIFAHEDLDVVILEVGIGGLLDATNVLKTKSVCGVTQLDYDHTDFLGNTIEEIAFQKGGIYLPNIPCLTINTQEKAALTVLKSQASNLEIVSPDSLKSRFPDDLTLGLNGEHQVINAALASRICELFVGEKIADDVLKRGLESVRYYGRCQLLQHNDNVAYHLDGAHTVKSMEALIKWIETLEISQQGTAEELVLVYNSAYTKDVKAMMLLLKESKLKFKKIYFAKPISVKPRSKPPPTMKELVGVEDYDKIDEKFTWQQKQSLLWRHLKSSKLKYQQELDESCLIFDKSVNEVVDELNGSSKKEHVIVTGSLLLVGDVLKRLNFFDFN